MPVDAGSSDSDCFMFMAVRMINKLSCPFLGANLSTKEVPITEVTILNVADVSQTTHMKIEVYATRVMQLTLWQEQGCQLL